MRIIIISSSKEIEKEAEILTKLFEAGLETLHLRKHRYSTKKMSNLLKEIPKHFHSRIIIHSHHNLARKYKLKGIHLTKSHKKRKIRTWLILKLIKMKNPNFEITTSFNSIGQLLDGLENYNYNYVFLSPIFDSLSSKFQSAYTEHSLKSALQKTTLKVIARGGCDVDSVEKARNIGFNGMAFYSSIWQKDEPLQEFKKIIEKFQELNIPIE